MTYIEFFDTIASENVSACLTYAPERVIYLQVDPDVSQQLMTGRYQGDESKKDIHESNRAYLDRSREAAEFCAAYLGWSTVCCVRDGALRPIEDISREVRDLVK